MTEKQNPSSEPDMFKEPDAWQEWFVESVMKTLKENAAIYWAAWEKDFKRRFRENYNK